MAKQSSQYWHNLSRLIGFSLLKPEVEDVLFLDVDEIVEGVRFAKWLEKFPLVDFSVLRLACHWYFRSSTFRANELEDTPLLARRSALDYDALMHSAERSGTFHSVEGKKFRFVSKEAPLVHHYSWVRSKEEMLRKVSCWGHSKERDWKRFVEEEFSHPFSGRDFVHGYTFSEVEPFFKPSSYSCADQPPKNVSFLNKRDLLELDLAMKFGLEFHR